jgi:HEAT repeat protein
MLVSVSRICHPPGMGKKRGILLAGLFAALAVGLVWMLSRPAEPVCQGKPLSGWLKDLYGWAGDTNHPAFIAFREMGTNAIPALLKIMQSDDPPFESLIFELNRMQSLVHFPLRETWLERHAACSALYAMGANAKPAFSTLTNLLFHTNAVIDCAIPLAGMGSEGLPPLLAALTNQNAGIRLSAANGLGWARSDMNIVVPALIARLSDQNIAVHRKAAGALGRLHAEPGLAVPALMKAYPGNDPLLRSVILRALSRFETNARAAVPMVLEALSDIDPAVRDQAASALKHIDPAAAAKAGVK